MSYAEGSAPRAAISLPWLTHTHASLSGWRKVAKRIFDLLGAAVLFALSSPVLVVAAILVRMSGSGPVFFVQRRVGYRCRSFNMVKLRTMVEGAQHHERRLHEQQGDKLFFKPQADPRVTAIGRFLRKYSIDELPQLLNVLRGDMSLVGPRPLLEVDLERFPRQEQMRRFSVKPGLTGLWQVSGRSGLSDAQRLQLDLDYVDNWSQMLDCAILVRTIPAVLSGQGAT